MHYLPNSAKEDTLLAIEDIRFLKGTGVRRVSIACRWMPYDSINITIISTKFGDGDIVNDWTTGGLRNEKKQW